VFCAKAGTVNARPTAATVVIKAFMSHTPCSIDGERFGFVTVNVTGVGENVHTWQIWCIPGVLLSLMTKLLNQERQWLTIGDIPDTLRSNWMFITVPFYNA